MSCGNGVRAFATGVVAASLLAVPVVAQAADTIDLRHSEYTFTSDGGGVGPWSVYRAIFTHADVRDTVNLEAVNGERDDPGRSQHGAFYRLEDFHRFARAVTLRTSFGAGNGYSPLRSTSAEVLLSPGSDPKYALAVGGNLTSPSTRTLQRVLALGGEWHAGIYTASVRYYQTATTLPDGVGPPTLALGFSASRPRSVQYAVNYNAGGEMSGDRTAAILPTGSGRAGPDATVTLRVPVAGLYVTASDEASWYRDRAGLRRDQHVLMTSVARTW